MATIMLGSASVVIRTFTDSSMPPWFALFAVGATVVDGVTVGGMLLTNPKFSFEGLINAVPPLYLAVGGIAVPLMTLLAVTTIVQLPGDPHVVDGSYIINSHGVSQVVSPERYGEVLRLLARLFSLIALLGQVLALGAFLAHRRMVSGQHQE